MGCFRKETAAAAVGAAADAGEDARRCGSCMHSEPLHGSGQVRLICSNRSGYRGLWYAVGGSDACARFKQAIDAAVLPAGARMIPLTQGKFALVDEADYADLIRHSWCLTSGTARHTGNRKRFYAMRSEKRRTIFMHRLIMGAKPGQIVDHINHNGLDNRRSNLRICTQTENMWNRRGQRNGTSRYKGVSCQRYSTKWRAKITYNGKHHNLGQFDSEIDAARAYNEKARELFGQFAYLNDV